MKRVLFAMIILFLLVGLAGCGGDGLDNQVRPTPITAPGDTEEGGGAGEEGGGVGQPGGAMPSQPVVLHPLFEQPGQSI